MGTPAAYTTMIQPMAAGKFLSNTYDVIVVGSRCAGSPTAMLLARKGYRVLLVDRATFPSDTISTHVVHPLAVSALRRWGLADALAASGCPPIATYGFDFRTFVLAGTPGTADEPIAYCPRRIILDKLLLDAAAAAGAEIREGFVVEEIVAENGRVVGIRGRSKQGTSLTELLRKNTTNDRPCLLLTTCTAVACRWMADTKPTCCEIEAWQRHRPTMV